MPKVSSKQATAAFAQYQVECPDDHTTQDIFISWLETDGGAFEKYVNDNSTIKPNLSLEEFKKSASAKLILQQASSNYALSDNSSTNAVTEVVRVKQESAYQKALRDTSILLKNHNVQPKSAFISYAWEDESTIEGREANEKLQGWLRRISKDLGAVGVRVFLDIEGMQGKMSNWMQASIEQSDYFLLIGTPRYKIRAGLETNVAFEYQRILQKLQNANQSSTLLPLLYAGDFATSFPAGVTEYLIRDFRPMERYYHHLLGLVKPLGIVPNIYPDLEKNGQYYQEYSWLFELFSNLLSSFEAQVRNLKDSILPAIADELPVASPYFAGRSQEIESIAINFKQSGRTIMAIQGIGGSGKSQLAVEYAYSSKISDKPYRLIRWLKADSEENLKNSYYSLGDDLGVEREDYKDSELNLRRAIQTQLLRYENILLIYDNVESLDYLSDYQPSAGGNSNIQMLITTRNRFVDCQTIEVKEFTVTEVQEYLNKRLKKDIPLTIAEQLGQELGYLPLAIVQAGAYMVKYAKTPETFLKLLQGESRQKVLEKQLNPKLKTIATLWDMTLDKLSPQALELIRLCAYLNPDNVPQSLLEQMLAEDLRDEVLYELRSQSLLIDADNEGLLFRIHRLLQEAVRRQLVSQDNTGAIAKAIVEKGIEALKIIVGNHDTMPSTDIGLFWKARDYLNLQTVRLIAEGEKLTISEALLATLLEWAGEYQEHITMSYEEGLKLYQRSLAIREVVYNGNHPDIATSLINVGGIYEAQGQYDKALEYYQQSFATRKALYGDNHPNVATSVGSIGNIYKAQGQYDKALEYYQQALAIERTIYGDQHSEVAGSLGNIGSIYYYQGQHDKALEYYRQSLAIRRDIYGDKHPDVATSLGNIGTIYHSQGQYDQALEYCQQSLAIYKIIYGDKHPNVATSLDNIGSIYYYHGQYNAALEYHQQALAIRKIIYGDKHPDVATVLNNIGLVYHSQGQYDKALECYQQAIAIKKAAYGDWHPDVATSLNNIGGIYEFQGQYNAALECHQQAIAIRKATYGNQHPAVAISFNSIGRIHEAQGQYDQALEYYQQALEIDKATYGDKHQNVAISLSKIGNIYKAQGQYDKALEYYQQALANFKATYGDKHPMVAISFNNIGRIYDVEGQYEQALEYYQQSLAIQSNVFGNEHPDTIAVKCNLELAQNKLRGMEKSVLAFSKASNNKEEEKSNVAEIEPYSPKASVSVHDGTALTVAYDSKKTVAPNQLLQEASAASSSSAPVVAPRRGSRFEALLAKFQPRAKNTFG